MLFQAQTFAGLRASAPAPDNPALFASHYLAVKDGRWFSIYPPVYPLLLAAGLLLLGSAAAGRRLDVVGLPRARLSRRARRLRGPRAGRTRRGPVVRSRRRSAFTPRPITPTWARLLAVLSCLRLLRGRGPGSPRGLAAALAAGIRPFEAFWVLLPAGIWAARGLPRRERERALAAALLLLAVVVAVLLRGPYLDVVNSGGRLAVLPNLNLAGNRQGSGKMVGDAAKWTLAYGYFAAGNLKDAAPQDLNVSFLWLGAGLLWAAWEARRDRSVGVPPAVPGDVGVRRARPSFYAKKGGPYGERRFFEAIFLLCLFPARLLLLALRRLRPRYAVVVLAAALGVNAAWYLPATILRARLGNARRLQLFSDLRRLGESRGLVYVAGCPDFDVSFCLRNRPDLSGNVFVARRTRRGGKSRARSPDDGATCSASTGRGANTCWSLTSAPASARRRGCTRRAPLCGCSNLVLDGEGGAEVGPLSRRRCRRGCGRKT